jgi:hypothetical protein
MRLCLGEGIICRVANLVISDESVTIQLSFAEKAEALHGDLTFLRSAIAGVRVVSSCLDDVPGFKLVGAGVPGTLKVGTWAGGDSGHTFAACHGNGPGLVIDLTGEHYDRIVLSHDNPELLAAQLA